MAERKNPELDAKHQAILRKMMQQPENKVCADCKCPSPRWASTNLGIFVCITCSGIHRKLGTHISQVRSVTLDTWTPSQISHFQKRGNAKAAQYFEACLPPDFQRPSSADAMRMERFIRDKYEKKRYITVENGGLGGGAMASAASSVSTTPFATTQSGSMGFPRPFQQPNGRAVGNSYDDGVSTNKKATSSMSYGARFGAGTSRRPASQPAQGRFNNMRGLAGSRTNNAFQRANTLKEILNMGFSPQLAARAVEAGEGDLQRAVDWVLEQDTGYSQGNQQQRQRQPAPVAPKVQQKTIVGDLMDFGSTEPASVETASHPSKHLNPQPIVPTVKPVSPTQSKPLDDDFGDFGDFESALPSVSAPPTTAPKPAAGSFSSSIASLYAKPPPPVVPKPTVHVSPTAKPLRTGTLAHQSPTVSPKTLPVHSSPKSSSSQPMGRPVAVISPSKKRSPGHAEFPKFEWPADVKLDAKNPIPSVTLTPTQPSLRNVTQSSDSSGIAPPQPPPPPIEPVSVPDPETGPPPPPGPPPTTESNGMEQSESVDKTDEQPAENGQEQKEEEKSGAAEEPEEEDPFAALSMFALQSATTSKKTTKPKTNETKSNDIFSAIAAPDVSGSQGFNLDELLG